MKKITGMSLIELLIGLALSLLLLSVIIEIYLAESKIEMMQDAWSFIEENAQHISNYLRKELHLAGYVGCVKHDVVQALMPYDSPKMKPGTQGFIVHYMSTQTADLMQMIGNNVLEVDMDQHFHVGDELVIANCEQAEIITIQSLIKNTKTLQIIAKTPLSAFYTPHSEVGKLLANAYYVGQTNRQSARNAAIYALYQVDITGQRQELIEGVNDMQVRFINTDSNQKAVSIKLLLTSINYYLMQKQVYLYVALR